MVAISSISLVTLTLRDFATILRRVRFDTKSNREQSRPTQRDGYGHTRRSNGWHQPANQPDAEGPTDPQ
jgi:hypothetical protein